MKKNINELLTTKSDFCLIKINESLDDFLSTQIGTIENIDEVLDFLNNKATAQSRYKVIFDWKTYGNAFSVYPEPYVPGLWGQAVTGECHFLTVTQFKSNKAANFEFGLQVNYKDASTDHLDLIIFYTSSTNLAGLVLAYYVGTAGSIKLVSSFV